MFWKNWLLALMMGLAFSPLIYALLMLIFDQLRALSPRRHAFGVFAVVAIMTCLWRLSPLFEGAVLVSVR